MWPTELIRDPGEEGHVCSAWQLEGVRLLGKNPLKTGKSYMWGRIYPGNNSACPECNESEMVRKRKVMLKSLLFFLKTMGMDPCI